MKIGTAMSRFRFVGPVRLILSYEAKDLLNFAIEDSGKGLYP